MNIIYRSYEYVGGTEITKVIDRNILYIIDLNTLMSKVDVFNVECYWYLKPSLELHCGLLLIIRDYNILSRISFIRGIALYMFNTTQMKMQCI